MQIVISPAKTLDLDSKLPAIDTTEPRLGTEAAKLIPSLRRRSKNSLRELMNISADLAAENQERFRDWSWPHAAKARPALWMFKGDVFLGIETETLGRSDVKYVQARLSILSGLYGVLRPLDRVMPYRLEMSTKLKTRYGRDLYDFWKDRIRTVVETDVQQSSSRVLVNLASNEYFKALQPEKMQIPVVTPIFKDWSRGQFRVLSFFAKRARGMMVRYAIDRRIRDVEQLQHFDRDGYSFNASLSNETEWVFTRMKAPSE